MNIPARSRVKIQRIVTFLHLHHRILNAHLAATPAARQRLGFAIPHPQPPFSDH